MKKEISKKIPNAGGIVYYLCVFIPIICVILAGCIFYFVVLK